MLRLQFELEDTTMVAVRDENVHGQWSVTLSDGPSGIASEKLFWTDEQLGATLALAAGVENEQITLPAYTIAEPLFQGLPRVLRFIP